eukprot:TRINITY_DN5809_c0_g1_i2.p1 TRINITY_DN5809_c0_g1~~TRINITY_DN5809_c0_g1_i2.p1  ORF type:complete len:258 (-),score=52.25 TRINITY_DN5809_c0_g1_i2:58-831(-)
MGLFSFKHKVSVDHVCTLMGSVIHHVKGNINVAHVVKLRHEASLPLITALWMIVIVTALHLFPHQTDFIRTTAMMLAFLFGCFAFFSSDAPVNIEKFDGRKSHRNVLIEVSPEKSLVTKISPSPNKHVSALVAGTVLRGAVRKVTFNIRSSSSNYVMIGVMPAVPLILTPFPGHKLVRGCSYYGHNGHIYIDGGSRPLGPGFGAGDQVTVQVDRRDGVSIQYFVNHVPSGKPVLIAPEDLVIVCNIYTATDCVEILD